MSDMARWEYNYTMRDPLQDIHGAIHQLENCPARELWKTINQLYMPDAIIVQPFYYIKSNEKEPWGLWKLGGMEPREAIYYLLRWQHWIFLPALISIDSKAFDENTSTIYVDSRRTFSLRFLPQLNFTVRCVSLYKIVPCIKNAQGEITEISIESARYAQNAVNQHVSSVKQHLFKRDNELKQFESDESEPLEQLDDEEPARLRSFLKEAKVNNNTHLSTPERVTKRNPVENCNGLGVPPSSTIRLKRDTAISPVLARQSALQEKRPAATWLYHWRYLIKQQEDMYQMTEFLHYVPGVSFVDFCIAVVQTMLAMTFVLLGFLTQFVPWPRPIMNAGPVHRRLTLIYKGLNSLVN